MAGRALALLLGASGLCAVAPSPCSADSKPGAGKPAAAPVEPGSSKPAAAPGEPGPAKPAAALEISFYAAASLRDVLRELAPDIERDLRVRLVFNFGASNDLARQIIAVGKADLFFSADEAWMDAVAKEGLVDETTRSSPLSNRLVVVVPADEKRSFAGGGDLAESATRRLSLANPETVPAGKYAKAWLLKIGAWEKVKERVVPAVDVRAALAAVESGSADAGVVYATDAAISKRVRVAFVVPEEEGPRISYAIAAMRDRPHLETARRVAAWLVEARARSAFQRHGFITLPR